MDSNRCEIPSRHEWSLHVRLRHFYVRYTLLNLILLVLAGSTSLPLTMNGGLFEAVSPTGGRYGFVLFTLVSFGLLCA